MVNVPDRMKPAQKRTENAALRGMDEETRSLLYVGAAVSQLAVLFQKDNRTIAAKIASLEPIGLRGGYPIYSVAEAAACIVTPKGNLEEVVKRMNPADIPGEFALRFWSGLRERDRYLQESGELWESEEVMSHFAPVFQTLQMNLHLLQDKIQGQTTFSEHQRNLLTKYIDEALEKCRADLLGQFETKEPQQDPSLSGDAEVSGAVSTVDTESEEDDDAFFAVEIDEDDEPEAL